MAKAVSQLESREALRLPKAFVEYVENKIREGQRRPHTVKRLGSMGNVLDVLVDLWLEREPIGKEAKKLGISRTSLWGFLRDIEPLKEKITSYLKDVEGFIDRDFRSYISVANWERMIRLSGHLSQLAHIRSMERVCRGEILKGFRCSPDRFDLGKAQEFVSKYLKQYRKLKVAYNLRMAIRHFLACKRIVIPRGFGGQYGLSGEKDSYGKYAYIKLSEDRINEIREILKGDPEALENAYDTVFDVGITTCSRAFAIGSLPISKIGEENNPITMQVFEPKIKEGDRHLGKVGMWWTKYIPETLHRRIREFIERHPERSLLFCDRENISSVKHFLMSARAYLKRIYREIGLTDPYFYAHPLHCLRHVGAHRLLKKTNYNYGIVAKLGGWKDEKTLKDCYGEMPDELIIKILKEVNQL